MTLESRLGRWMQLSLAALLCAVPLFSQAVSGSLVGTVTDVSGAVVPSARVTVTETNTGISRTGATNPSGGYVFTNLNAGRYRVEIEQPGFSKAVRDGIDVFVNSTVRVDIQLRPGEITQTVDVVAEVPLLQTDRVDTGRQIEIKQVAAMPLGFNRNFQSLINLVPGATRAFRPHSEFFNPQDSLSTRINGQPRLANNLQLEGVDNNHRTGLLSALIPPIEAIQAIDITTGNYEAELGRAGGAVTNVTLRSGTNELHGSVFHFNRVSRLGARNFFATGKPVTTYNLFGFTLGGPIQRNRTFFFGNYQGVRDRRGDNFFATIPTMEFRTGDLRASPTTIYDPATGDAQGRERRPFAENRIPTSRISPIARRILDMVPAPTAPGFGTNFQKPTVRKKDTEAFDIKIDHQLADADKLSVRYSFQRPKIEDPPLFGAAGGGGKGFAGIGTQRMQSAGINYSHIFSPTVVTDVRVGMMRYRNVAENADIKTKASEDIGIRGVNVSEFTGGLVGINVNGFSNPLVGYAASLPWVRAETNFNVVNNWTLIRNSHTFKFGFDVRRIRDDLLQTQTFSPRGLFTFTPGTTALNGGPSTSFANSLASFLLDLSNNYGRDLPIIFPAYRQSALFLYAQDKWQVTPKLTLDLGLRWEHWPPATPAHPGGFSNYNPADNTLRIAGIGANPMNLGRKTYWTNFAPRFGAAFRFDPKTVLRAGYGISYVPFPDNSYAYNFPVRQNNAFNALNTFSAAGSMAAGFPPPVPAEIPQDGILRTPPASNYDVVAGDYHEAYVQSWNLSLQRALPKEFTLEAAYVGNLGIRINSRPNLNAGLVAGAGANGQPLFQQFRRTQATTLLFAGSSTNYHSLQMKFDRRFSGGFLLTTAYTFGKAMDRMGVDNGGWFNYIHPHMDYARGDSDVTHVFVQSYIYELPFGKGKPWLQSGPARWILGDWQVNGIFTSQVGTPLNFTYNAATLNAPGNGNRPNITGPVRFLGGIGRDEFFFDTSNFSAPPAATFGNMGRNLVQGPGLVDLTFSAFRMFPIGERIKGEFRAEFFNLTNTPHFNNPNAEFGNANFGKVTGAQADQRQIQFGLKFTF